MNCSEFKDSMRAFLDEVGDLAAAREHLRECPDCRRCLEREQQVAELIRHSLQESAAAVSLGRQSRRRILQASAARRGRWEGLGAIWEAVVSTWARPIGVAAGVLALLCIVVQSERQGSRNPGPTHASSREALVIDVPMVTETHVFQRQSSTVVDRVAASVSFAHALLLVEPEHPKHL